MVLEIKDYYVFPFVPVSKPILVRMNRVSHYKTIDITSMAGASIRVIMDAIIMQLLSILHAVKLQLLNSRKIYVHSISFAYNSFKIYSVCSDQIPLKYSYKCINFVISHK